MKSGVEANVVAESCNGSSLPDCDSESNKLQLCNNMITCDENSIAGELMKTLEDSVTAVSHSDASNDGDNFLANDELSQSSSCQLWLYKCVLEGCSASFELLADLQTHFICKHQSRGEVLAPCCFCLMEFPTWNNSVTSHIASHVRIHSVSCVECQLKFESKNLLMKHLRSTHSGLPSSVSFDVSINNYERRRKPASLLSTKSSEVDISSVISVANTSQPQGAAVRDDCKTANSLVESSTLEHVNCATEIDIDSLKTRKSNSKSLTSESINHNNLSNVLPENIDLIVAEESSQKKIVSAVSESDVQNNGLLFDESTDADKSVCRTGRRKARKPVRVTAEENEETADMVKKGGNGDTVEKALCEDYFVDLVAALQPMAVQCSRCSYTCNTELHLKVHTYDCHENPRGNVAGSMHWFTCRYCGTVSDNVSVHRVHVAHHRENTAVPVRMFVCVYCDRCSDSMEVLEEHVLKDHPSETLKFEVMQLVIAYLQDMMTCPLCSGAFSWKEDLFRHFGAVHRLDELVRYLESEYASESLPTTCRVPRAMFKDLVPLDKCSKVLSSKADAMDKSVEKMKQMDEARQRCDSISDTECNNDVEMDLLDLSAAGKKPRQAGSSRYLGGCEIAEDSFRVEKNQWSSGGIPIDSLTNSYHRNDGKKIQRFHCDICDFSANSHPELVRHLNTHDFPAMSEPEQAKAAFDEDVSFPLQHKNQRIARHGLRYRCDQCPFATSKSQNLQRHVNIHIRANSMQEGFRCGYCSFAHKHRRCIIFHLSRYHSDRPVRFSSVVDGEVPDLATVTTQSVVDLPMRVSPTAENAPEKADCSNESAKKPEEKSGTNAEGDGSKVSVLTLIQQLPLSMIYSTPVKCPACDFTNRVRINLIRHIRLYHGENSAEQKRVDKSPRKVPVLPTKSPFPEALKSAKDRISKWSASSSSATVGIFVPSNEEPVFMQAQNTSCDTSFCTDEPIMSSSNADGIGSSVTPFFRCKVCGYQSARQYSTKQHVLSVHRGAARFSCMICQHVLSNWRELAIHVWRSHPGQLPLAARQAFKDHALYLRENITKISGYHHTQQEVVNDVKETSFRATEHQHPGMVSGQNKTLLADNSPVYKETSAEYGALASRESPSRRRSLQTTILQCRKCAYAGDNPTVMRQHVMAHHLHYKPYACPYCDTTPRYVKSFPITKHVRLRHPHISATQRTFLYLRDEEMEKKVRSGYRVLRHTTNCDNPDELSTEVRTKKTNMALGIEQLDDGREALTPEVEYKPMLLSSEHTDKKKSTLHKHSFQFSKVLDEHLTNPAEVDMTPASGLPTKKVVFSRCCFCGLVARWRADLRYHLMREIGYKPFRCGLCVQATGKVFAEPTRPALAKHMRLRHHGMYSAVIEQRDPAKEEEIDQLLERCASSSLDLMPEMSRSSAAIIASESPSLPCASVDSAVMESRQTAGLNDASGNSSTVTETNCVAGEKDAVNRDKPVVESSNPPSVTQKPKKKKRTVIGKSRLRRCPYCTYRTPNIKRINKHMVDVHGYAPFRCAHCEFTEHYPSAIRRHCHQNHPELPFSYVKVDINGKVLSGENRMASASASVGPAAEEPSWESDNASSSEEDNNSDEVVEQSGENQEFVADSSASGIVTTFSRSTARKSASSCHPGHLKQDNCSESVQPSKSSVSLVHSDGSHLVELDDEDVRFCCELCPASFATSEDLSGHNAAMHSNDVSGLQSPASSDKVDENEESVGSESEESSGMNGEVATSYVRQEGDLKLVVRLVDICWGLKSDEGGVSGVTASASSESDN